MGDTNFQSDYSTVNSGSKSVSVAQVGCGYWGRNLVRTLDKLGVLACVVDDNPHIADTLSTDTGTPARSLEDVLGDRSITAVSIATPASGHYAVAKRCLEAGKDVFVEKPMALNPEHADELIQLAESKNRILMVGHLLNYHPAFGKLMELIGAGELGRLRYVYSNRLNFGKIRREEDILWSFAPHDLSMILRVAGELPSTVSCVGAFALHERIADVTTTHLSFPSGLRAHVFVSWLHPHKEQRFVVVGDNGMAVFDDVAPWPQKLALFRGSVDWVDGTPVAHPRSPTYVDVPEGEPLLIEMQHFVECVAGRATPVTDGREGKRVLAVLNQATEQLTRSRSDRQPAEVIDLTTANGVHPTAVVDEGTTVGPGTKIWHFSHVLTGSIVGKDCSLGQNVVVGPNVKIGNGCKIQNNVSVYDGVTLEDDVFCGPSMVFTNVQTPRAFVNRKDEFTPTVVERGASIGANATVVCGTTIGEYAMVGAGAVVTRDVLPYALVLGVPARQVGWVSKLGDVLGEDLVCPRSGERYLIEGGRLSVLESGVAR